MNQRKAFIGVSVFNTNKDPILRSMSNSVVGTDDVYRYNFKTITEIRP